ncbi:dihydropteroate synthase [bacterium]|nr:dihydropteroate synthase [bacterium]
MQQKPALVMGILNVTPDSFSDGGKFYGKGAALVHAERLVQEGADIIDVGGESTRPGSVAISLQEEMDRVLPIVEAVRSVLPAEVSVDTRKFEIAREAIRAGATIINDITGGSDPRLLDLLRQSPTTKLILMHMKGTPETMQDSPVYPKGVLPEVRAFLAERVRAFREGGISKDRLWVDPGIGFGKTYAHNLELLRGMKDLAAVGGRLVCATSRKAFLAAILGDAQADFASREAGTLASNLWALAQGASVFRVHDVAACRRALKTWAAIEAPVA